MRVLLALLACLLPFATPVAYAQDATTLLSPSKPKAPEAIALAEIPGRADADERYAEEVSLRAGRADPLGRLVPRLASIEQSVAQKNSLFAYGELRTLPVIRLESMERHWKFDARQYARWRTDMQGLVAPYAQDAAELALRRADIRAYSLQSLDRELARLREEGLTLTGVELVGHADRLQGRGHDYNQGLSERRAQTVRALLVERGIDAAKVTYSFKGDGEQVQQCEGVKPQAALRECLIPNRRVEVRLHVAR